MSSIPSRTRSLRKPADSRSSKYGQNQTTEFNENTSRSAGSRIPERSSQSPSRLPLKLSQYPPSSTTRPPSASGSISNASIRPPSARANISKPTTSGLQRSSSNRISNTSSTAEPVKQDRSRPPLTASRHLRNPSVTSVPNSTRVSSHTRNKSSSAVLNASTTLRPPTLGSTEAASRPSHTDLQTKKPAFSTLQQHFSPAKNLAPKPHPAAFLVPPSPSKLPSNIAISAETAKLQNELLQLHLLHKNVQQVEKEWRVSAKKKLGARFKSVVDRNEALVQLEVKETSKINAAALQKWQGIGTPGWGLEEKIQILGEVVTGVWNMGESGGKYTRIIRKFEKWLSRCQEVLETRDFEEITTDDVMFLEELDNSWKDDCLVLGRKLESWRDQLKGIGTSENGSSLATTINGCQNLVRGMLMELAVMQEIETNAMRMEIDWIKSMNDEFLHENEDIPRVGAIWRRL